MEKESIACFKIASPDAERYRACSAQPSAIPLPVRRADELSDNVWRISRLYRGIYGSTGEILGYTALEAYT
jgi:hypothetical protein